jgi:hypothetical protein
VHCTTDALHPWRAPSGRPPKAHEQILIAHTQAQRVLQAPDCEVLLADSAPLMTAILSELLLADCSLYSYALAHHAVYDITLLTGLDLPWLEDGAQAAVQAAVQADVQVVLPDGLQYDAPLFQRQVDARLRELLQTEGFGFSVVYGQGAQRCNCALTALDQHALQVACGPARPRPQEARWQWVCEKCSDAQCEHQLFSRLLEQDRSPHS